MSQQIIDIGQFPNDPSADAIRLAFDKVNNNFTDLYSGNSAAGVDFITPGRGITVSPASGTGNVTVYSNIFEVGIESPGSTLMVSGSPLTNSDNGSILIDINPSANITFANASVIGNLTAGNIKSNGALIVTGTTAANSIVMTGDLNISQFAAPGAVPFVAAANGHITVDPSDFYYSQADNILYLSNGMSVGNTVTAHSVIINTTLLVGGTGQMSTLIANTATINTASVTGNLTAGNITANIHSNALTVQTLTVQQTADLGNVSNVQISGGVDGQLLTTDGNGALAWSTGYANINAAAFFASGTSSANIDILGSIAATNMTLTGDLQAAEISGAITATTSANLGAVGNVHITGGNIGQALTTDGAGNLSWETVTTGAAGSNGQLQFNSNGAFGATANLFVDEANNALTIDQMSLLVFDANATAIFGVDPVSGSALAPNLMVTGALTGMGAFTTYGGLEVGGGNARIVPKLTAESGANLSDVANVNILGGNVGEYLTTDGAGNLSWAQVANALVAGTVYTNAQPNITSVGTLANLTVTGGVSAEYFLGALANGQTAITMPTIDGNIEFAVSNTAVLSLSTTAASLSAALSVTGNVAVGGTTVSRIKPRVNETTSVATLTVNGDTTDQYNLTAQAEALTVAQPTGTPFDGQKLTIRIEDNGTAQSITWTTTAGAFRPVGAPLPTTTVATKTLYVGCIWNEYRGFWDVVSAAQEA